MIDYSLLENTTIETLKKSGWDENRKTDVSQWIKQLESEGFHSFPYALEILEKFGELEVIPENKKIYDTYPGDFDFYVVDAGSGEYDRLEIYEPIAKEKLFPLGMVYGQNFLYVGQSHKIFMGKMNDLYLLGNNIEEFLNNLILGLKEPILIIN